MATRHINIGGVMFTDRERTVLIFVAKGLTDREMGQLLGISPATVRDYTRRILRQLDLERRIEAAVWAAKQGLV